MVCHGLAVVAGRGRDQAAAPLLLREGEDAVERPALLEGAGLLQVLELEVGADAAEAGEVLRAGAGTLVDRAGDPPPRLLDQFGHVQGIDHERILQQSPRV